MGATRSTASSLGQSFIRDSRAARAALETSPCCVQEFGIVFRVRLAAICCVGGTPGFSLNCSVAEGGSSRKRPFDYAHLGPGIKYRHQTCRSRRPLTVLVKGTLNLAHSRSLMEDRQWKVVCSQVASSVVLTSL
jgi:hypothetical protein